MKQYYSSIDNHNRFALSVELPKRLGSYDHPVVSHASTEAPYKFYRKTESKGTYFTVYKCNNTKILSLRKKDLTASVGSL